SQSSPRPKWRRRSSRPGSRSSPPVASLKPGKKNQVVDGSSPGRAAGEGSACEGSTYDSALRCSTLMKVGADTPAGHAVGGRPAPNSSTTTSGAGDGPSCQPTTSTPAAP